LREIGDRHLKYIFLLRKMKKIDGTIMLMVEACIYVVGQ